MQINAGFAHDSIVRAIDAREWSSPVFKYVLVPATGTDIDGPIFAVAHQVARLWSSHLQFLHVRIDAQQIFLAMASAEFGGSAGVESAIEAMDQQAAARQQKAELAVRQFCERQSIEFGDALKADRPTAEWRVETGEEAAWITNYGRAADLLVAGRGRHDQAEGRGMLEAALMQTGRPVLIPSTKPRQLDLGTVVIAWKDTREAARAISAAMPFIEQAKRVFVLSVEEGGSSTEHSCDRLCHALRWHNANTEVRRVKPVGENPIELMLQAAAREQGDLLVMGAYSHSRLREVVFGGFTRRVLASADLPVLIAH
jgi:nucleotide-binding universal stress UspA family protein